MRLNKVEEHKSLQVKHFLEGSTCNQCSFLFNISSSILCGVVGNNNKGDDDVRICFCVGKPNSLQQWFPNISVRQLPWPSWPWLWIRKGYNPIYCIEHHGLPVDFVILLAGFHSNMGSQDSQFENIETQNSLLTSMHTDKEHAAWGPIITKVP